MSKVCIFRKLLLVIVMQLATEVTVSDMTSTEVDLALGRPATQSSTFEDVSDGICYAGRAVNGENMNDGSPKFQLSCSVTNDKAKGPNWWRVKLDRAYHVQKVTVKNRKDCCADRLDYFIVGVTNSSADPVRGKYPLCGQYPSTVALAAQAIVRCNPNIKSGQYVIIQQPVTGPGLLTLCEVHVYARSMSMNLAIERPATQSSTYVDISGNIYVASRAVDGNYRNNYHHKPMSCSTTNDLPGGPNWWRVKLDRPYRVQNVTVTNRADSYVFTAGRLDYFIVGVTNSSADPVRGEYPLCGQYPSKVALGAKVTLNCNAKTGAGQYVIIQQPLNGSGWFTLCEVEVYAIN